MDTVILTTIILVTCIVLFIIAWKQEDSTQSKQH